MVKILEKHPKSLKYIFCIYKIASKIFGAKIQVIVTGFASYIFGAKIQIFLLDS